MPWIGFDDSTIVLDEAEYAVTQGGDGPPVLLLHGFPQTHACWSAAAPALARHHTVVAPDIRGYGASRAPAGGPHGGGYTNPEMAGGGRGVDGPAGAPRRSRGGDPRR